MLKIRPSQERGSFNFGWLDTKHTFSFGQYYDPSYMGFATLRVINEDKISPGQGFQTHSHRDMEIITYIIEGQLEHKDSMGNSSVIHKGELQRMSAGTGVSHSEYNGSASELVHLLQIWIVPHRQGLTPSYEQKYFGGEIDQGKLILIGSQNGRDNSLTIHQDVNLYKALLPQNGTIKYITSPSRNLWLQMIKGHLKINDQTLLSGDGIAISEEEKITIIATTDQTEFLLFDLQPLQSPDT